MMTVLAWMIVGGAAVCFATFGSLHRAFAGTPPRFLPEAVAVYGFMAGFLTAFICLVLLFIGALVGGFS